MERDSSSRTRSSPHNLQKTSTNQHEIQAATKQNSPSPSCNTNRSTPPASSKVPDFKLLAQSKLRYLQKLDRDKMLEKPKPVSPTVEQLSAQLISPPEPTMSSSSEEMPHPADTLNTQVPSNVHSLTSQNQSSPSKRLSSYSPKNPGSSHQTRPIPRPSRQSSSHASNVSQTTSKPPPKSHRQSPTGFARFSQDPRDSSSRASQPSPLHKADASRLQRTTRSWRRTSPVPDNSSIRKLQSLNVELTNTLSMYESGNHARTRVQRMQMKDFSEWAYKDDDNVDDFYDRIVHPALEFPFELDSFQKRAILHVEAQETVFVAAHTSAGKTVVAEYAIALASSLGSKVFYTSPIKTISNQKLRDFREKFDDVGLVTGDVSINDNAQCVIMTTEILRSMLYRGADAIRDVSYVVFDEVQFLNDEERGVVWEESIIMLPPHIGIIMLSATVPNALEFAAWVGKTKNRRVAVVSTSNRPVPLEHAWLHTSKDDPDVLQSTVLLKQGGPFLANNYRSAVSVSKAGEKKEGRRQRSKRGKDDFQKDTKAQEGEKQEIVSEREVADGESVMTHTSARENELRTAEDREFLAQDEKCKDLEKKQSFDVNNSGKNHNSSASAETSNIVNSSSAGKRTANQGPKGRNKNKGQSAKATINAGEKGDGPNSLRSPWTPVVKFVHENRLTPTVLFCFSKKKCEQAVESLENSDLLPNTGDKALVHSFFESAIVRLREEDRQLPQVLRARANLKRGISAHHAGLLPLIKEITEILFSKGLVKLLFATETFAMGVNMPARTVIFTGLRKNDGRKFRNLDSGEFIQMSGRAGRRGLDDVGHVYLFFPPGERIPDERPLCQIMTGEPISLKSAFRLTYNMILNVLRVDELRVEEMMKQSFSEAGEESKALSITDALENANTTLNGIKSARDSRKRLNNRQTRRSNEALHTFVENYVALCSANSKLPLNEVLPVLKASIHPGRVVVARLVDMEMLVLGMVYSIIPDSNRGRNREARGDSQKYNVERYTLLWLATIVGVEHHTINEHPRSALLLPEPLYRKDGRSQLKNEPRVVTSNGLIVSLRKVRASDIMYISEEVEEIDVARRKAQETAARSWVFAKKALPAKRTLLQNATFLQTVVARWFEGLNGDNVDTCAAFPCRFGSAVQSKNEESPSKGRKSSNLKFSKRYKEREELCLQIVSSFAMAMGIISLDPMERKDKLERLIVEESIRTKMVALQTVSKTGSESSLLPEYTKRVEVLQKLNYVGEDGLSVQLKGRCACEVATADCVALTEVILENVLNGLNAAEVASLLSSFVCRKKNSNDIHKHDAEVYSKLYCDAKAAMRAVVENVGKAQLDCGIDLSFDIGDGGDSFEGSICRWDLAHAVYSWACGEPFCNITNLTEQQEGDIVVCVKRLSELIKDAESVAKGVGNDELCQVLDEAITSIRRDVIFNGSLYLVEE